MREFTILVETSQIYNYPLKKSHKYIALKTLTPYKEKGSDSKLRKEKANSY